MSRRRIDINQNQLTLTFDFDEISIISVEGGDQETLSDFEFKLRQVLKGVLEDCGKRETDPMDRYEVAARLSRKLGREISKTHVDQWTAMSTVQRRIHVDTLKALCEVTGDMRPMHFFVESCGFKALDPIDATCAEFGAQMALKRHIEGNLKDIQSNLDNPELLARLLTKATKTGGGK